MLYGFHTVQAGPCCIHEEINTLIMIMNGIMEVELLARKTSATNPPAIS